MASFEDVKRVLSQNTNTWGYREMPNGHLVCSWTKVSRLDFGIPTFHKVWYPAVLIVPLDRGVRIFALSAKLSEVTDLPGLLRTVGQLGVGKVVVFEDEIQLSHFVFFEGMTKNEILSAVESIHDVAVHLANGIFLPEPGSGRSKGFVVKNALGTICPNCGVQGRVLTMKHQVKTGFSTGKASAAILTGGASVLATGLAKKSNVNSGWCQECDSRF